MNFDFADGERLLRQTAREYLTAKAPLQLCRRVFESESGCDRELWKDIAEMGWQGTAIPADFGGAGFGYLALAVIAEELGRALAPIPFASSVYLATEAILRGGSPVQKQHLLPGLAAGHVIGTLALAERPGHPGPEDIATVFESGHVSGTKVAVPDGMAAHVAIVVTRAKEGIILVLVELDGPGVQRYPADSIDPTRPGATLTFDRAHGEPLGGTLEGWTLLERVLDSAAVLLAFEQIGGAERALELTTEFTLQRYAFGRPVGSFQALKHRMVDVYVATELARSNGLWGAAALGGRTNDLALAACSARISATRAFDLAAVEMVQMHGGVGFTWEHDCHLFYRRARHDAVVIGSAHHWREQLMRRLVTQRAA